MLEDFELGKDNFHLCRSGLVRFYLPQVYHFLGFINWFSLKYSSVRREVGSSHESRLLCKISLEPIKKMLNVPKSQSQYVFPFNEENIMVLYQQLSPELRSKFFSKFIKQGQEFGSHSLSFPVFIFNSKFKF